MNTLSEDTLIEIYMQDTRDDEGVLRFLDSPECTLEMINYQDEDGWTALILAAKLGRYDVVKKLIEKGADVNETHNSQNAFMFVINEVFPHGDKDVKKHLQLCQLLIDAGTNIHFEDRFSTFTMACQVLKKNVIELLLSMDINIDFRDEDGKLGEDYLKEYIEEEDNWKETAQEILTIVENYRYRFKNKLEETLPQKQVDKKNKI